jgi:hypothetical protein
MNRYPHSCLQNAEFKNSKGAVAFRKLEVVVISGTEGEIFS